MKKAFDMGYFDKMLVDTFKERKIEELSESQKERLLSKLGKMVVVHTDHGSFSVMKYQVTQVLWDSVEGRNPSELQGAGLSVDQVSWLDCVIFANKMSEKEGLERVYEISDEAQNACSSQVWAYDRSIDRYAKHVKRNILANGYRLPTNREWEYMVKCKDIYMHHNEWIDGRASLYKITRSVDSSNWASPSDRLCSISCRLVRTRELTLEQKAFFEGYLFWRDGIGLHEQLYPWLCHKEFTVPDINDGMWDHFDFDYFDNFLEEYGYKLIILNDNAMENGISYIGKKDAIPSAEILKEKLISILQIPENEIDEFFDDPV